MKSYVKLFLVFSLYVYVQFLYYPEVCAASSRSCQILNAYQSIVRLLLFKFEVHLYYREVQEISSKVIRHSEYEEAISLLIDTSKT